MSDPRVRMLDPGADPGPALHALDSLAIDVCIGSDLSTTIAGAAAALVAMCARIFAHVTVTGNAALVVNPWRAESVAEVLDVCASIRPEASAEATQRIRVAIGHVEGEADLWLGGGAYTIRCGRQQQSLDADQVARFGHALGVHAGACLVVADLMKTALAGLGHQFVMLGDWFVWNLLDYRLTEAPAPERVETNRTRKRREPSVLFAGTGSVGTSAVAVLAMSPGVRGVAQCVDLEAFDEARNPFRYPALSGGVDGAKSTWAVRLLSDAGWSATGFVGDVGQWCVTQSDPGFDGLVVSSVDTASARFAVADVLARQTCSIGVAGLALHAQVEYLGDGLACPYCDFVSMEPVLSQADVIANHLGLDINRVIELQQAGSVVTETDVAQVVAAGRVAPENACTLVGRRIDDLIARVYAEATLPAAGSQEGAVAVAAPHVSWFAGVLGAAEVAKLANGLPALDRRVDVDLVGIPQGFTERRPADMSGRCACGSGHRRRWAERFRNRTCDGRPAKTAH